MNTEMNAQEIIDFISNAKKQTPVKVYLKGQLSTLKSVAGIRLFTEKNMGVAFGDWSIIKQFLIDNASSITDYELENMTRNSAVPLLDLKQVDARIEPGAIIRDKVEIGANAVIMMGAIINIGAKIGTGTMIDMGAVLGGRAIVGNNAHIGANAVLAGVVEPPSAMPVIIEDDVLIGANAVVIEGVKVGKGAIVAAGAIVIEDVAPYTVVGGIPARKLKDVDAKTGSKTQIMANLRKL
ncbi:2,3,4,5-tetrahydropyridine-2,6-dicarboxylate N-acetyltransferase [Periweissella beninensis]|uniref:2,3,4,5-tetrahydropyridine-2,6-dicarboxylate N-acetyltransferase n=1 Tax=Periweissella beninensis TaxID=504936 RepID=UPI0021A4C32F|nr:2,3,4,5-tetrahydropyridine-2,6-dicarboxylate N-acetyltransferase [Periweissella beninensis]